MSQKRPEIKRSRKIMKAIRQILYCDWDPIGVYRAGPEDEYDSCIGPVYHILSTSRSEQELTEVLQSFEMEATETTDDVVESVARKLLGLSLITDQ